MTPQPSGEPSQDQIAARAYYLWEQAGRPQGKDAVHWDQALSELKSDQAKPAAASLAPAAPNPTKGRKNRSRPA